MKIRELQEKLHFQPSSAKLKHLQAIFTPDNIKDHYKMLLDILGDRLSFSDIDAIKAELAGSTETEDSIDFNLKMMVKKLQKFLDPVKSIKDGFTGRLLKPLKASAGGVGFNADRGIEVQYLKGKWHVMFYSYSSGYVNKKKKFDTAKEALIWAEKMLTKMDTDPSWW